MSTAAIPVQPLSCSCPPGQEHTCLFEDYGCDCCGLRFETPLPWYEHYGVCDLYYCEPCGLNWKNDGAAVVRVVGRG